MAINYTVAEATKIMVERKDRMAMQDICRRYPVFANAVSMVSVDKNEGMLEILYAMPQYVTASKINKAMREMFVEDVDDEELEKEETKKRGRKPVKKNEEEEEEKPKKRGRKPVKKEEPDEDDEDDWDDEEEEEEEEKPKKRGRKPAKKTTKKSEPEEDDEDFEDDDDDDWDI